MHKGTLFRFPSGEPVMAEISWNHTLSGPPGPIRSRMSLPLVTLPSLGFVPEWPRLEASFHEECDSILGPFDILRTLPEASLAKGRGRTREPSLMNR